MDDNTKISVLESKHLICALMFLRENGTSSKTAIYEGVSKNPRMPEKLRNLESIGLIEIDDSASPTRVSLTDIGVQVADHLLAVRNIINNG